MALSLTWSYGFDKDLVGGVQSLGEGGSERKSIFFVSGTTGVIFTHDGEGNKTQTLLQGHVNAITGVVISTDKKRIVTADKGKDSLLVVWDSETATPVKTIYRPHPTGVQAVDITPDSRFIVSLSAPIPHELIVEADHGQNPGEHESSHNSRKGEQGEKAENKKCKTAYGSEGEVTERSAPEASASTARSSHPSSLESSERTGRSTLSSWNGHSGLDASDGKRAAQDQPQSLNACRQGKGDQGKRQTYQSVAVWDWRELGNTPVCVAVIATPDLQHSVLFNSTDAQEILTNGKRRVFFWFWEETSDYFHFYSPALQAKDFKQKIGDFTRSIFMPNSTKAATGTVDGDVVLWDLSLIVDGLSRPDERRAVRILNLSRAAVTFLSVHDDNWIVAGFADGIIGFYDFQFRILRWFDDFNAGPINSISFDRIPNQGIALEYDLEIQFLMARIGEHAELLEIIKRRDRRLYRGPAQQIGHNESHMHIRALHSNRVNPLGFNASTPVEDTRILELFPPLHAVQRLASPGDVSALGVAFPLLVLKIRASPPSTSSAVLGKNAHIHKAKARSACSCSFSLPQ
ncbi:hypothetical protein TGGT1_297390 [Toxoplasma gondii GT1]|uniref:Cilia- and flagella-associated protein 251 n=4 Tax=Toxoplasma gondii TaxID=5811 RepID=S7UK00_TOXGG|nr:hypothetical protein TGGT1_297390 [Toxoplasma gondii GT1]KAF4645737.1 hypothetical protein TGRH88_002230 [Toxoplasma gondii]RQX67439.1 putative WD domain, G-beta repeat protein [Toxoplasma gondii CAST]